MRIKRIFGFVIKAKELSSYHPNYPVTIQLSSLYKHFIQHNLEYWVFFLNMLIKLNDARDINIMK